MITSSSGGGGLGGGPRDSRVEFEPDAEFSRSEQGASRAAACEGRCIWDRSRRKRLWDSNGRFLSDGTSPIQKGSTPKAAFSLQLGPIPTTYAPSTKEEYETNRGFDPSHVLFSRGVISPEKGKCPNFLTWDS